MDDAAHRSARPFVVVLGIAQDAGYPQAGNKDSPAWDDPSLRRLAACLGIVDPIAGRRWLIDATPDFKEQLHRLDRLAPVSDGLGLDGILLTHAHIGHYTGLIHLGREAIGARALSVYAMPKMTEFLRRNAPWEQLVRLDNIRPQLLQAWQPAQLAPSLRVTPLPVPHRDEYSETVAFIVQGPRRQVLYLPDIDSWDAWDATGTRIEDLLAGVDVAYLDGTFYSGDELPGRNLAEIPHPLITASLERFAQLPAGERSKIRFIHLNQSNPLLQPNSRARTAVESAGFGSAHEGELVEL